MSLKRDNIAIETVEEFMNLGLTLNTYLNIKNTEKMYFMNVQKYVAY